MITLLLATFIVFLGTRALPGDPALIFAGENRDEATVQAIREKFGLDQPLLVQFGTFLKNMVQGDLGNSIQTGIPVTDLIATALPVTAELALLSLVVAVTIGFAAGVVAAVRRGRPAEWIANIIALLGLSVPHFWLGMLAILWLSVGLGLFPSSGFVPFLSDPLANLHRMAIPALVIGASLAAVVMRQTRSSMLEALSADYVRTARAKGLAERQVIGVHAVRNSLIVVVTIVGLQLGNLLAGAVVIEQVFSIPGFGKLILDSVFQRDYPVIQGVVLLTALAYIVINLLVDLLYSVIDPRIRVRGSAA